MEKNSLISVLNVDPEYSFVSDPLRGNPKDLVSALMSKEMKRIGDVLLDSDVYPKISAGLSHDFLARNNADFKNFRKDLKDAYDRAVHNS